MNKSHASSMPVRPIRSKPKPRKETNDWVGPFAFQSEMFRERFTQFLSSVGFPNPTLMS